MVKNISPSNLTTDSETIQISSKRVQIDLKLLKIVKIIQMGCKINTNWTIITKMVKIDNFSKNITHKAVENDRKQNSKIVKIRLK